MILRDDVNKIIYVTTHKCGCSTISYFLMRLYNENINFVPHPRYLISKGYGNINENHKDYFKILILRDPFKRFFSALYQDCKTYTRLFEKINLNVGDFLGIILDIKNNSILTKNHIEIKNLIFRNGELFTHIIPQYDELKYDLDVINKYNFLFDKVIDINDLFSALREVKYEIFEGVISIPSEHKNKKKYVKSDININTLKICNLCLMSEFPDSSMFDNPEIRNLIREIYRDDYDLIDKFGVKIE